MANSKIVWIYVGTSSPQFDKCGEECSQDGSPTKPHFLLPDVVTQILHEKAFLDEISYYIRQKYGAA